MDKNSYDIHRENIKDEMIIYIVILVIKNIFEAMFYNLSLIGLLSRSECPKTHNDTPVSAFEYLDDRCEPPCADTIYYKAIVTREV